MWFFLFSQFSSIVIIVFNKNFLYPIEDIDFLSSNLKKIFYLRLFFVLGHLKLPNLPYSGLNYARFEKFNLNAELFMHGKLSRATKSFQIELRLANWS